MFGKRILILSAHPDDEVVGCAASVMRARALGATVSALYLTHGCLSRETLWPWQRKKYDTCISIRRTEADAAALALGIQPVGWSNRPARHLWRELPAVMREIKAALAQYRPDQIWVPAYEGGNPDHDALNALGSCFRGKLSVLEFSEYNNFNDRAQSQTFISSDETTRLVTLTPEEQAAKQTALALYASEKKNLSAIGVAQESYRPLAPYDYTRPPHQGKLWYARFQWVPFRHPRVDRTNPAEVSAAIAAFLSAPKQGAKMAL